MISRNLLIVIVDALIAMVLLWSGVRALVQDRSAIVRAFPRMELSAVLRGLLVLPFALTALFVAVAFVLDRQGDVSVRAAQAVFLLGWWGAAVIMVFSIFVGLRSPASVPASAVIGLLFALPPLILFTSTARFAEMFSVDGYDRPVIIGLALAAMSYTVIRRLERAKPAG
ncbi:MAG: hypothetical protein HPY83_14995 [Anaerolineae bacterium]|nr:hypothetical protein [Anaerolineae bacterium]